MPALVLIAPILIVIILGVIAARFKLFDNRDTASFVNLVFYVVMPVKLFTSVAQTNLAKMLDWPYIFSYLFASLVVMIISVIGSKKFFQNSNAETTLNLMASNVTNSAYLALPLFLLLFNNPIPAITVLIIQSFINIAILISLENNTTKKQASIFALLKNIFFKNPIFLGILVGFLVCVLHLQMPIWTLTSLNLIGNPASFLALFSLGLSLVVDYHPMKMSDAIDAGFLIFLKVIVHPLLGFLLGKFIFHLNSATLLAVVLMCAMPSAKNTFIFAKKYGVNSNKFNRVVFVTTLLAFVFISVILFIHQA